MTSSNLTVEDLQRFYGQRISVVAQVGAAAAKPYLYFQITLISEREKLILSGEMAIHEGFDYFGYLKKQLKRDFAVLPLLCELEEISKIIVATDIRDETKELISGFILEDLNSNSVCILSADFSKYLLLFSARDEVIESKSNNNYYWTNI